MFHNFLSGQHGLKIRVSIGCRFLKIFQSFPYQERLTCWGTKKCTWGTRCCPSPEEITWGSLWTFYGDCPQPRFQGFSQELRLNCPACRWIFHFDVVSPTRSRKCGDWLFYNCIEIHDQRYPLQINNLQDNGRFLGCLSFPSSRVPRSLLAHDIKAPVVQATAVALPSSRLDLRTAEAESFWGFSFPYHHNERGAGVETD